MTMTNETRETLRAIAQQLREYTRDTPDLVANLQDHARALDALAAEPPRAAPQVISNEPRGYGGPFGGRRR
jgi:hypothetical protein